MIKVICVGKIKENYLKDAIIDYSKRISKYHKFELIEVHDSNIIDEKNLILKYINKKDFIISLAINGKKIDSIEFSSLLDNVFITHSNITFIIGGSYGLDEEIISNSNYVLSFSSLTFPHQLFRVMLLEQIYRAFKILNNESYHK